LAVQTLQEVDESELTVEEAKERKIMKVGGGGLISTVVVQGNGECIVGQGLSASYEMRCAAEQRCERTSVAYLEASSGRPACFTKAGSSTGSSSVAGACCIPDPPPPPPSRPQLLLKVKNGTPPQRKSALRQLTGGLKGWTSFGECHGWTWVGTS